MSKSHVVSELWIQIPMVSPDLPQDYVYWFRQSSPYINSLRKRTVVLTLSGETVANSNLANIIHDIALLNSLGVRLIIVHGARCQINQRIEDAGYEPQFCDHQRITCERDILHVTEAVGAVKARIEALLSMGLNNTPMQNASIRIASGNFITAKPLGVIDGVDYKYTGEVRKVDRKGIKKQLELGNLVIISCVGYSPTGEIFNLNTEDLAMEVAIAMDAEKLIYFNQRAGVIDQNNKLIDEITFVDLPKVLALLPAHSETFRQLKAAQKALNHNVPRAHIISYEADGALIGELFTREGKGTMIIQQSYEQMRKAELSDLGGLLELIEPLEQQGILVRRSRELLEQEIDQFFVIDRDGMIIGCAALYPFDKMAELACIAVHPDYREGDRGSKLLSELESVAVRTGIESVFVLTTRTAHWFIERGFDEAPLQALPDAKQSLYNLQRNSKVYKKELPQLR